MNLNWKKLFFISLAAIMAVTGVLYFRKTVVSPPQELEFGNQHLISLQQDASRIKNGLELTTADSLFETTLNAARLFQKEGFIGMDDADQIVKRAAEGYVPYFVETYKQAFARSEWSNGQNSKLRQKARLLMELRMQSDGSTMLGQKLREQVDSANIILDLYDNAWKLCERTRFVSLDESERIIKQAREYASTSPICNCAALTKQLYSMREALENSHYKKVCSLVDELESYRFFLKDYYMNTLVPRVYDAIKEYKENAQRVYGTSRSVQVLETRAKDRYNLANDYYDS